MKYSLKKIAIAHPLFVALTENEYKEAKQSNDNLDEVLSIEEAYNFLLETYVDFERGLLDLALHRVSFHDYDVVSMIGERHRMNLKLATFLTMARLYMDQTPKSLASLYKRSSGVLDQLRDIKNQERKTYFSYRVMEVLRNHIQHQGLPIFGMTYPQAWKAKGVVKHTVASAVPWINIHDLKNARGICSTLKAEINSKPNKTDLRPLIREYMESVGRIHKFIRSLIDSGKDQWQEILHKLGERYQKIDPGKLTGLGIVVTDNANELVDKFFIHPQPDARLASLQQRNSIFNPFSIYTVTNELQRIKDPSILARITEQKNL